MRTHLGQPQLPSGDERWNKPAGKHTCVVCTGTACHIKGAQALLTAVAETHGIQPGETTPDGELSLLTACCLGACGLAPAVVVDSMVLGQVRPFTVLAHVGNGIAKAPA